MFEVNVYASCFCRVYFITGCPAVSFDTAGHDIHNYLNNGNSQQSTYCVFITICDKIVYLSIPNHNIYLKCNIPHHVLKTISTSPTLNVHWYQEEQVHLRALRRGWLYLTQFTLCECSRSKCLFFPLLYNLWGILNATYKQWTSRHLS